MKLNNNPAKKPHSPIYERMYNEPFQQLQQCLQFKSTKKRAIRNSSRSKSTISSLADNYKTPTFLSSAQQVHRQHASKVEDNQNRQYGRSQQNCFFNKQNRTNRDQLFELFNLKNKFPIDLTRLGKLSINNLNISHKRCNTDRETDNHQSKNYNIRDNKPKNWQDKENYHCNVSQRGLNNPCFASAYQYTDRPTSTYQDNPKTKSLKTSYISKQTQQDNISNIDNIAQFSQKIRIKQTKNNRIRTKYKSDDLQCPTNSNRNNYCYYNLATKAENDRTQNKPKINANFNGNIGSKIQNCRIQVPYFNLTSHHYNAYGQSRKQAAEHKKKELYNICQQVVNDNLSLNGHCRYKSENLAIDQPNSNITSGRQSSRLFNFSKNRPINKINLNTLNNNQLQNKNRFGSTNKLTSNSVTTTSTSINTNPNINTSNSDKKLKISDFQFGLSFGQDIFGKVYPARHTKTGFILCIKQAIKKQVKHQISKFTEYLKIHSYCSNPYIVDIFGIIQEKQKIYILMEYHNEYELFLKIKNQRKQALSGVPDRIGICTKDALAYVSNIIRAIKYLHDSGIVYRNIRPQNISLLHDCCKISNLSWSCQISKNKYKYLGPIEYCAPELLTNPSSVDKDRSLYGKQCDIWAIGILLYQMLVGVTPCCNMSHRQITNRIVNEPLQKNQLIQPQIQIILKKVLMKNSFQRLNANQFLKQVQMCLKVLESE